MTISKLSYAKLNLFLHITGKRADGYHNLQTLFCRLKFGDCLTFLTDHAGSPTSNPFVTLTCDTLTPNINDNLIIKAANALLDFARQHHIGTPTPVHIVVDKKIPTGAGLGGGSSNAATTLLTLNELWQTHLDTQTLIELAKSLGADVPFFVLDTPYAIGENIGEKLTPIALPALTFLLVFPDSHNSTQGFFSQPTLKKDSPLLDHDFILKNQHDYLYRLAPPFFNAFETLALNDPNISTAHHYLNTLECDATPRLTGTGSTVFLPIDDSVDAQTLALWQKNAPYPAIITEVCP